MAFIHHTDTANYYSTSQSGAIVRAIYRYHTQTLGYCDIAYNFLIDKYGTIYEGRNGGISKNVIGAHTGGYNYGSVGIAMMGNFSTARPTSAMLTSLTKLLAWRLDIAHVPAVGTVTMTTGTGNDHRAPGTLVTFNRIAGHRDASYTNCPGNYLYSDLSWIRARAQWIGLPKIYLPVQSSATLRPDGDGHDESVKFTAGFSGKVSWTLSFRDSYGVTRRTLTGSSYGLGVSWSGLTTALNYVPTGQYTWTLSAVDAYGHPATPASGTLDVVIMHPAGTVLQDSTGKYVLQRNASGVLEADPINDPTVYASAFGTRPAVLTGWVERLRYPTGPALGLRDGTLLVDQATIGTTSVQYYVWSDDLVHHITADSFAALGYRSAAAIPVSATYLGSLPPGAEVSSVTNHPNGTAIRNGTTGNYYVIEGDEIHPATSLTVGSWYRANEIVPATSTEAAAILAGSTGSAYAPRDGTFIKATDGGAPWLVSDGTKHRFISSALATAMGYTTSMMISGSPTDIAAIPTGTRIG